MKVGRRLARVVDQLDPITSSLGRDIDDTVIVDLRENIVNCLGEVQIDFGSRTAAIGDPNLAPLDTQSSVEVLQRHALINVTAKTQGHFATSKPVTAAGEPIAEQLV